MILNELESKSPFSTTSVSDSCSEFSSRGNSKESTPPTPPDTEFDTVTKTSVAVAPPVVAPPTQQQQQQTNPKKTKKNKPLSRAPIATGISTNIPVTGEKPKPIQEGDASLDDNVLYKIFLILFEKDPKEEGMTVKQLCEMLETLHPELVNMSSKTSNLVSAKLNAYIKKLEKADLTLQYAISREWADASPKRMVYKYRGLLAPGWEKVMEELKKIENAKQKLEKQQREQEDQEIAEQSSDVLSADDESSDVSPQTTRKNSTVAAIIKEEEEGEEVPVQQIPTPLDSPTTANMTSSAPIPPTTTTNVAKRRATMFDFGRRPSFLSLDEFPEPPPPYLVNKSKITPVIDDDEVFIDVDEEDDEQDDDHRVVVKKRRTISSISKFNWGNLGSTELDTAAITAMRRESVSTFEVGVSFPSPLDTSLQDLDKMFSV